MSQSKGTGMVLAIAVLTVAGFWITGASNVLHLAVDLLGLYFLGWAIFALLSNRPLPQLRTRFLLVTGTLISFLVLAEAPALLGLIDYRSVFSTRGLEPLYRPEYVPDRELLWIHPPHYQHADFREGNIGVLLCIPPNSSEHRVRYDHNGFRNETDMTGAEIAVIGDSYVEATMVPGPMLMTSVLSELEKKPVVNLGVGGYAPQQELVVLKRYALNLHPKTVVWVVVEGNIGQVIDYQEKRSNFPEESRALQVWWLGSFTRNALWALLRLPKTCTPNSHFQRRYGIVKEAGGRQTRIYFPGHYGPLSERDEEAVRAIGSLLAEARQLSRERGIRFVLVFSPKEYRVYHDLPILQEVSQEVGRYVLNDLPERLRSIVTDIAPDIEFLDLTPMFQAEAARGTPIFLPDDSHWAPEGHRIAAQAIHRVMSSRDSNQSTSFEPPLASIVTD